MDQDVALENKNMVNGIARSINFSVFSCNESLCPLEKSFKQTTTFFLLWAEQ
jgi:hypothetical protein